MRTSSLAMSSSRRLRFETIETCRGRNSSLGQNLEFGAEPRIFRRGRTSTCKGRTSSFLYGHNLEFGNGLVAALALGGVVQR